MSSKQNFLISHQFFQNIDVTRNDIGEYMKTYAEENDLLKQPQRIFISSFKLTNGILITPLFNFYLDLGLQYTKIHRFVQYTPSEAFKNFFSPLLQLGEPALKIHYLA